MTSPDSPTSWCSTSWNCDGFDDVVVTHLNEDGVEVWASDMSDLTSVLDFESS